MKWFKNLKVAYKENFLIGIMLFSLIIVGLIGFYYNMKTNESLFYTYENRLLSVKYLDKIIILLKSNQANIVDMMLNTNPEREKKLIGDINKNNFEISRLVSIYAKHMADINEKQFVYKLKNALNSYLFAINNSLQLVQKGKKREAYDYYLSHNNAFFNFNNILYKLSNYNDKKAENEYLQNKNNAQIAKYELLSSIIISLIILIPLGFYISKSITDPLKNLIAKMEEVASGNFNVEVEEGGTKDEIGRITNAFKTMKLNLKNLFNIKQVITEKEQFLRQLMLLTVGQLGTVDIIETIVTETGRIFGADRCFFVEYDNDKAQYLPIEEYELYIAFDDVKKIQKYVPFNEKHQCVHSNDINIEHLSIEKRNFLIENDVKSFIMFPVIYKGTYLGAFVLHYVKEFKIFNLDEINFLNAITSQSSIIIHQSKLYNQLKVINEREGLLRSIINKFLESENMEEALNKILKELGALFNLDRVAIRMFDPFYKTFSNILIEYEANDDIPTIEPLSNFAFKLDKILYEKLYLKKEEIIIDDLEETDFLKDLWRGGKVRSIFIKPLIYGDKTFAAIFLSKTVPGRILSDSEIETLNSILQQVSIGINLFKLKDSLNKSLQTEKTLRKIIIESRSFEDYSNLINYFSENLISIFNVDSVLRLQFFENGEILIQDKKKKNQGILFVEEKVISGKIFQEIKPKKTGEIIIVNDIHKDIKNVKLREFFEGEEIISFLVYSVKTQRLEREEKVFDSIIIGTSFVNKWEINELDTYKIILETATLIGYEIKQRQEVEEIKRTFLATLTHDLRSPIYAEQKALEFIMSRDSQTHLSTFYEYLEDIYKTNEELLRIVNNILSVYHYESGKFELRRAETNIIELIDASVRSMKHLAKDQESEIITVFEDNLPTITADKDEINRVITNLIGNAIKHNKKGTSIKVEAIRVENELRISVSDNGKGIPDAEKIKIFQRYPVEKRKIGTGLGLYLSKQIVDAHNGKIWFETEVGKGTTFHFTLPVFV